MIISMTTAVLAGLIGAVGGLLGATNNISHKEGYKEGWSDASKTYEEKFKALRNEAQKAYGIISEQKRLLREANELIADMESYINDHKTVAPEIALTYANARDLRDGLRRRVA